MEGIFLTWTQNFSWSGGRHAELNLNFIFAVGDTKPQVWRRSSLRQGSETAFGDKEVHHRRMIVHPKPIVEDLPESLTSSVSYDGGSVGVEGTSAGGVNSITASWHQWSGKHDENHTQWYEYELRVEESDSQLDIYGYGRQKWGAGDWSNWTMNPPRYIARYNKITGKVSLINGYYVNRGNVHFVDPIFPNDWQELMDSRRPFAVSDTEALSECVRSTISELTTLNSNNIQNCLEFISLVKDIYTGDIGNLLDDFKDTYNAVKLATITRSTNKRTLSRLTKGGSRAVDDLRKLSADMSKKQRHYDVDALKKVSKRAADGWLKYRYVYNTTKMDVEAQITAHEREFLGQLNSLRVLRGQIGITNGRLRVKMRLHDKLSPNFMKFEIRANQVGMFPGLYELWDLIPFSFVADWFSPLGDYLKDIEEQFLYANYYQIDELLVSRKQTLTVDEPWGRTEYLWYDRELLHDFPQFEFYEDPKGPSKKVVTMRSIDAASFVVGTDSIV